MLSVMPSQLLREETSLSQPLWPSPKLEIIGGCLGESRKFNKLHTCILAPEALYYPGKVVVYA